MRRVDILRVFSWLVALALLSTPALAQSTIEGLTSVPTFPLPDPATTPSHLWITQGCATPAACDYKIDPLSLGSPYQSTTAPSAPYPNQLWWNTSTSPATLEAFQNSVWTPVSSRIRLAANSNLYVGPSGSDTNNGCTNSLAPCLTIQHAANVASMNYDFAGFSLTINIANGTYAAGATMIGPLVGASSVGMTPTVQYAPSKLMFVGNVSTPSSVIIADTSSPSGFFPAVFSGSNGANFSVQGMTLSSVNGFDIFADTGALVQYGNVIFGNAGYSQVGAHSSGIANMIASYSITGSAPIHWDADNGFIRVIPGTNLTITLTGTPAYSTAFAAAQDAGFIDVGSPNITFSGSATGPRFLLSGNSSMQTSSVTPNPTYLPGSTSGILSTGGRHDPPLPPTVSAATGLGVGGTAVIDPNYPSSSIGGTIQLTAGSSGTSSTGTFLITFATNLKTGSSLICTTSPLVGFPAGSSTQFTGATVNTLTVSWTNGPASSPANLTTNSLYYLNYVCNF